MSWNDGFERNKFNKRQEKLAENYRKLGMTEEQINEMYKFDLQQYQSDRRYYTHVQPLSSMCSAEDFDLEDEGVSPLLEKFLDELSHSDMGIESHSRYWWVEEVSNPYLLAYLERLSDDDLEIITLFAFEHYSQVEIAKIIGISERSVHRKIAALRISAKK